MDPITWIIAIALFAGAALAFSKIRDWINSNKNKKSQYADVLKEKLSNGKYRVVTGIFDNYGYQQKSTAWETDKLADDLKSQFGSSNRIRVQL
ncbi:MAG: hypothetical protein HOP11_15600 [Saprospiraceae bacterium]|nr:hypothetical protein [Saprospiraceae bacterium]